MQFQPFRQTEPEIETETNAAQEADHIDDSEIGLIDSTGDEERGVHGAAAAAAAAASFTSRSLPFPSALLRWCARHPAWAALAVALYTAAVALTAVWLVPHDPQPIGSHQAPAASCVVSGAAAADSSHSVPDVDADADASPAPLIEPTDPSRPRLQSLLRGLPEHFYNRSVAERAEILMSVEYPSLLLRDPVTLVVAYYRTATSAKHSTASYDSWLRRFLGVSVQPMLVATSPNMFHSLAALRYHACTTEEQRKEWKPQDIGRIQAELSSSSSSCPPTHWLLDYASPFEIPVMLPFASDLSVDGSQHRLDPERNIHHPFLYAVWNSKPWLLNHTAHLNPFSSNYFAYVDAGFCREDACRYPTTLDPQRIVHTFERDDQADRAQLRRDKGAGLQAETETAEQWSEQQRRAQLQRQVADAASVPASLVDGFVPTFLPPPCAYESGSPTDSNSPSPFPPCPSSSSSSPPTSPSAYPPVSHPHPSAHPVGAGRTARRRHMMLLEAVGRLQTCPLPIRRLLTPLTDSDGATASSASSPALSNDLFAGGFLVGSGPAVRWFAQLHESALHVYKRRSWFWGKDQTVFNSLAAAFSHSFLQLEAFQLQGKCGNLWFWLPQYFQPDGPTRIPACNQFDEQQVTRVADRCLQGIVPTA